jgi:membrane-associated phospholipid phosphatase
MASAALYTFMGISLAHTKRYRDSPAYEPFFWGAGLKKAIVIATTRIYLGAHSLNQVIFGFTLGLWISFFCYNILQPKVKTHL